MHYQADRYEFSGGMIRWYFAIDGAIYQVNSQQYWEALPRAEILGVLYRHEKRRLEEWLAQREVERARARAEMEEAHRVKLGLPQIRLPGRPRVRLDASERERRKREVARDYYRRTYRHKRALPRGERLFSGGKWSMFKPDGSRYYATFPLSDHDYIEAMFWLYSQGRSRLLA